MTDIRELVIAECFYHGPMKYRDHLLWFECVGFDGEGCPARLGDEQIYAINRNTPIVLRDSCIAWQAEKDLPTGKLKVTIKPAWNVSKGPR